MRNLKHILGRIGGPRLHGMLAGCAILVIASLGLFYMWHAAREAQLDAVRTELTQLARVAATLVDGDAHRSIKSQAQAGSAEHLRLLAPLVRFHKATSDIIYVYTAVLRGGRIYYVLGTDYLYRIDGDTEKPDPIMMPHDTRDPTLRRALERHEIAVNEEPVQEAIRSYMSAYAPFYDAHGAFVGVVGVDMWVRDFDARIGAIRSAGFSALAAVALLSLLAGIVVFRLSRTARQARDHDRVVQERLAEAKQQAEIQAQRAEAASKAKSDFLAMMSHEIRTPMNGVLGFANLLLETPLNAEQREFVQTVQRSGDTLLTLINDVLDYSKIEAGRMSVEQIDFDLQLVCHEVHKILQAQSAKQGLAMTLSFDASLPKLIQGDPLRLRQILLNLAGNAVKFTEQGSVCIEVARSGAAQLTISVTDSGIGISAEQLERLFQRFTQADSSTTRRYGGTGLGLAISKTLAELMGGSIGARSEHGRGSTFWITLPLLEAAGAQPAGAADVQPATGADAPCPPTLVDAIAPAAQLEAMPSQLATVPTQSAAVQAARRGGRVLLVEDNFVNQRVAVYMLGKLGHHVDVARHGRDAIEMLSRSSYDLVLMDCQMPEMDGFEATRIIRDAASGVLDHDVAVVAMTANAFPEDRTRALASGMNDFLAKPVERAVLAAMLAKWLKPAEREAPRAAAG
jgi:signal transduction histidine kinase/ActR/RegA family two-component response regulator